MWTTADTLSAKCWARPARIAYLIPEAPAHSLLDALFDESFSRWGGRRTAIVPTNGAIIDASYWDFLNLWDADIIYSYVTLSDPLKESLFSNFAPADLILHESHDEQSDAHGLRPDYAGNFAFLSSLSLLPYLSIGSQIRGLSPPEILDKEHWAQTDRDLSDSFGFVSSSLTDYSLLPHAHRLSFRPLSDRRMTKRFTEPIEISYIDENNKLIEEIAKRRSLHCLSELSDAFCPYLREFTSGRQGWDDHLTVIIGDEIADRLLFWNAQHRYKSLGAFKDVPVLRLSPNRFRDGVPEWLRKWITSRNQRHLSGNYAPRTIFRSCSLRQEQLEATVRSISDSPHIFVSSEHHSTPCIFERATNQKVHSDSAIQVSSPWASSGESRPANIRFHGYQLELPSAPPGHLRNVAPSILGDGVWAVDFTIERAEDHSPYSNQRHIWMFPRRLRLEQAVRLENYVSGTHSLILPPICRPTSTGYLTIWDSIDWPRPTLSIPTDYQAFTHALMSRVPGSPQHVTALRDDAAFRRLDVAISDKGRDLLGVLQLFQSLPEALRFLTNPFWLKIIRQLSPEEPADSTKRINRLAADMETTVDQQGLEGVDWSRLAKRALSLAARSFTSEAQQLKWIDYESLRKLAIEGRPRHKDIEELLTDSTTYLRNRGFLWQGFGWRCSFCHHRNWIQLEQLVPIVNCEICRRPQSSPVSGSLHFRLNPFVHHAFASTSGQGPVLWCLGHLAGRARHSFAFVPALDIFRVGEGNPETDLDILASVRWISPLR
jgi:hypothetical protein